MIHVDYLGLLTSLAVENFSRISQRHHWRTINPRARRRDVKQLLLPEDIREPTQGIVVSVAVCSR